MSLSDAIYRSMRTPNSLPTWMFELNRGYLPGSNPNRGWHEMYQWVVSDEEIYFKSQTVGRIKLEIEFPFQNLTLIQPHPLKIAEYTVTI